MLRRNATSSSCSFTKQVGVQRRKIATIQRVAFSRITLEIFEDHQTCLSTHLKTARHFRMAWGGISVSAASSAPSATLPWSVSTTQTSISVFCVTACAAIRWTFALSTTMQERRAWRTSFVSITWSHGRALNSPTSTTCTMSCSRPSQRNRKDSTRLISNSSRRLLLRIRIITITLLL